MVTFYQYTATLALRMLLHCFEYVSRMVILSRGDRLLRLLRWSGVEQYLPSCIATVTSASSRKSNSGHTDYFILRLLPSYLIYLKPNNFCHIINTETARTVRISAGSPRCVVNTFYNRASYVAVAIVVQTGRLLSCPQTSRPTQ